MPDCQNTLPKQRSNTLSYIAINDLQAVWRRDWLKAGDHFDETTRVYWAQVNDDFVDIRIPLSRPNLANASCLADLDASALKQLMESEGFAGKVSLNNNVCTWHREINWHGSTNDIDTGTLTFEQDEQILIEDGVHANYTEQWRRDKQCELSSIRIANDKFIGWLIYSPTHFIYGLGQSQSENTQLLIQSLENDRIPGNIEKHFEHEYCFGHWEDDVGIADICTNPFCEHEMVLRWQHDRVFWIQKTFEGQLQQRQLHHQTAISRT